MVARGGGSLEDLWPFNDEMVARALATSRIPTLSAVGHETDFTIADFVADLRAPTPSAGAERVVQAKEDMAARIDALTHRLDAAVKMRLQRTRARVDSVRSHRVFEAERGRLRTYAQRVDDLARRAETGAAAADRAGRRAAAARLRAAGGLSLGSPGRGETRADRGPRAPAGRGPARAASGRARSELGRAVGKLESLSPLAVLQRGYALVFDERGVLVQRADQVAAGDVVDVRLHEGALRARVTSSGKAEE